MTLHPILPLPLLILTALLVPAMVAWCCYGACRSLSRASRLICVVLSILASLAGVLLLLNPGTVTQYPSANAPVWVVGMDVSASMRCPVEDDPNAESRLAAAHRIVDAVATRAEAGSRDMRWVALGEGAQTVDSAGELKARAADARSSAVLSSLAATIEALRRQGRVVAGALLLSDGRDTRRQSWQSLVGRAGAAGCPVHVLPLGSTWQEPDLAVSTAQPLVQAYPGVDTRISARIANTRMGDRQLQVQLQDAAGNTLETRAVELGAGQQCTVPFLMKSADGEYVIRVAPQNGESRADNNEVHITVRAVASRIRVFLAEGSPYWDSKFLAQYLRAQPVFDVRSVHRLSDERFYHINTGDEDAEPSSTPEMPTTLEGLMGYDIVMLGKGMEHLLDESSVQALQDYLKDQGGIVVMARGRCYGGRLDGMESMEPFIWGSVAPVDGRFMPTAFGADTGLFGHMLPAPDDARWKDLPALDDVWPVAELRSQTQVLATLEGSDTPVLGVMRYGMGAVACLNGEGLWKWDFYPEAREKINLYREFWRQFLPWVQTAAEFLPGFDLSLHPERSSVSEGESTTCLLGWRGLGRPESVKVEVTALGSGRQAALLSAVPRASSGLPRWEVSLPVLPAGDYLLRASVPNSETPQPECRFTVKAAPGEMDVLDADPELLARVAEATGGLLLSRTPTPEQLDSLMALPPGVAAVEERFSPLWSIWQVLAFITLCLSAIWFIRRRKGLP